MLRSAHGCIDTTVRDIAAAGGQALAVTTDVTQRAAVQQMVQTTVENFGGPTFSSSTPVWLLEATPSTTAFLKAGVGNSSSICSGRKATCHCINR